MARDRVIDRVATDLVRLILGLHEDESHELPGFVFELEHVAPAHRQCGGSDQVVIPQDDPPRGGRAAGHILRCRCDPGRYGHGQHHDRDDCASDRGAFLPVDVGPEHVNLLAAFYWRRIRSLPPQLPCRSAAAPAGRRIYGAVRRSAGANPSATCRCLGTVPMHRQRRAYSYRSPSIRWSATDAGADRALYNEVETCAKEGPLMTREGAEGLSRRRVWFVTGASCGFGLEIGRPVLERPAR